MYDASKGGRWLPGIAVALGAAVACHAPDNATGIAQPAQMNLAGQEWNAPVNLGSGINTSSAEGQLGIAPNGKSLYVSSDRPGTLGDQDIWVSRLQPDGTWGPLVNLGPTVNTPAIDVSPSLSLDGHYLYLASRRPGGQGGLDCWRSYRDNPHDDFGWSVPENLGPAVNTTFDEADCLPVGNQHGGGEFWFTSLNRPGGSGGYDIYRSEIATDGTFEPPAPVVELNTAGRDTRFTLTGNGLTIYFTSNRAGGVGLIDIWTASRKAPNSPFCTPVNLGAIVNSSGNENSPSITTNGQTLYFTSSRSGGFGQNDVYMTTHIGGNAPDNCM